MADLPDLPPRSTKNVMPDLPPRASRSSGANRTARAGTADARPRKPDPGPMRFVYGAGAVAAVSVMTVGLVQPSWAPAADDQRLAGDAAAANADGNSPNGIGNIQPSSAQQDPNAVADVRVRHVIRYVHLKPGQTAPPGATVITPDAPAPRVVVARGGNPVANAPRPTARPPVQQPPTVHQPAPQPPSRPRPTTRQSGRP